MFEGSKKGLTAKYLINSLFGFNDVALTRGWASSGLRSIFRNKVFGKRASKRLSGQFISRVLPWRAKREGLIFHIAELQLRSWEDDVSTNFDANVRFEWTCELALLSFLHFNDRLRSSRFNQSGKYRFVAYLNKLFCPFSAKPHS